MSTESNITWQPPSKVEELFASTAGNKWANINRPTAGSREEKEVPVGNASFQLYSLSTPNGQKPGILLEELGIEYDAHKIGLDGAQFTSGFVAINPNSKIPAAVDKDGPNGQTVNLFESASILLYLAEKYQRFLPSNPALKPEVINWLFWQMSGQGPNCGNFGHFFVYAPPDKKEARDYGVARYGMEVQRLCSVLENHLQTRTYMVGEEYTIADIAIFPWFQQLRTGYHHSSGVTAATFLSIEENYPHVIQWANRILERPAVKRGMTVCSWAHESTKPWLVTEDQKDGEEKK
mmetsp:Transcript_16276/g.17014  ORF Transcript_16276/g.17014 Transcript_16276/m.17014 type:complete len:292 (-) Transcript_16276:31-906(-)